MSTMEIVTLKDVMTLGDVLAKSGFFQDARGAAQAVVKVLAGRELGFGPIASMTGVHIVKGKPVMSAMLIAAAIKRSGKYDYKVREHTKAVCKLEFFERNVAHPPGPSGWTSLGESSFSADEAKDAGLGGDNWRHYPKNMLFARAVSNGAKWYTPDIFGGPVYTPDELGIDVDGETGEVKNLSSVTVEETKDVAGRDDDRPRQLVTAAAPRDSSNPEDHRAESEQALLLPDEDRVLLIQEIKKLGKGIPAKDKADAAVTYGIAETLESTDTAALSDLLKWMRARVK